MTHSGKACFSGDATDWQSDARASYDQVAEEYAELTRDAPRSLPQMRSVFALLAELVAADGGGRVLDVGCGPGWWTGYLHGRGIDVVGLDLSPQLVSIARTNNPDVTFAEASVLDLPATADSVAGLVCWYVLHHVPDRDIPQALDEFHRVLRPGGLLLLGGHIGDSCRMKTEGYGDQPMQVLLNFHAPSEWESWLRNAQQLAAGSARVVAG